MITLYTYFRSSAAYRVRIGLHLKKIEFKSVAINLLKGEQATDEYRKLNSMWAVPMLDHDGYKLTQSLAILNYIDNLVPEPPLAAGNFQELAYVRQIALSIAADLHPLTNLRVMKKVSSDEAERKAWLAHWATEGMNGVEALLRERNWHGKFTMGDQVSVADLCIVPQLYSMRRFKLPLDNYPICRKIEKNCMALEAFQLASPETQPDTPEGLEPIYGPAAQLLAS